MRQGSNQERGKQAKEHRGNNPYLDTGRLSATNQQKDRIP